MTRGPKPRPAVERFWPKVVKTETCWNWTGARQAGGYGRFAVRHGHLVLAHRWSYEALVGPIAEDMTLDHLCLNTACVNPKHLEVVSRSVNAFRASRNATKTHCDQGHEFECRKANYLKRRAAA